MRSAAPLPGLVDSHCHLTWESFEGDVAPVVERMADAGVEQAIVVATSVEDATRCRALCAGHDALFPTAGIHPNDVGEDVDTQLEALDALLATGDFVAVGETGLDYYREWSDPIAQQKSFRAQCALAARHDLPVIVHIRDKADRWDCFDDVATIIESQENLRGVIHCYTGDPAHAKRYLAAGFYISFAGILTFPKGDNVRASAAVVPLSRTLVETDAPFLAPVPHRGQRNEPAYVAHTADHLATLKGVSREEARSVTANNARALFRLPLGSADHTPEHDPAPEARP